MDKKKIHTLIKLLAEAYPEAKCDLNYQYPFQLLIATILSAQTTDQKVNKVTAQLFDKYPTPESFLKLPISELEKIINPIGLFRTKAKRILETCKILVEEYNGEVPSDIDNLTKLPGVGRKTANVVLANAFKIPAFPVDTHVKRVAKRLGLTDESDPEKVERDLTKLIPSDYWIDTHHRLIYHGRRVCSARKPQCYNCPLNANCPYYLTT